MADHGDGSDRIVGLSKDRAAENAFRRKIEFRSLQCALHTIQHTLPLNSFPLELEAVASVGRNLLRINTESCLMLRGCEMIVVIIQVTLLMKAR